MSNTYSTKPPEEVIESNQNLRALIRNHSIAGRLPVVEVAKYLNVDTYALRRAIRSGGVPFAFDYGTSQRAVSYIGVEPFWNFMTQNSGFIAGTMVEKIENAVKEILKENLKGALICE